MTIALRRLGQNSWQMLALLPLLALSAFWIGGELALVALAAVLPAALLALGRRSVPTDTGAMSDRVIARLDEMLVEAGARGGSTGCLVIQFDDAAHLCDRLGRVFVRTAGIRAQQGADAGLLRPG